MIDASRVREIRKRAYELHLLASQVLDLQALAPVPEPTAPEALTHGQHAILRLLTQGRTNGEIALELGITEKTVRNQVGLSYACLGVANRVLAAQIYRRMCEGPS